MSTIRMNNRIFRLGDLPRSLAGRAVELPKELAAGVGTRSREAWLVGLGALAAAEEEGAQLITTALRRREELAERGGALEARGRARIQAARAGLADRQKQVAEQVTGKVQAVESDLFGTVGGALQRLGVPSRAEVHELSDKVEALTRRVAALVEAMQKPAAPAPRPVFTVASRQDGWAVARTGEADARCVRPTKEEALEAARTLAAAHAPSQLVIHRKDGTVQDTLSYEA